MQSPKTPSKPAKTTGLIPLSPNQYANPFSTTEPFQDILGTHTGVADFYDENEPTMFDFFPASNTQINGGGGVVNAQQQNNKS